MTGVQTCALPIYITAGNTATVLTITSPSVDYGSEVPVRNSVPSAVNYLAYCLGRMYGIDAADPHLVAYSEAEFDDAQALFVGRPEQSWPASNRNPFPTGEACVGIHEYRNEVWVWTRNHLGIMTEFGGFTAEGGPTLVWKAIHVGGLANHRAFAKTPYGPFWVSADKELMTMGEGGPVPISEEYSSLLAKISDANLTSCELMYLRDPQLAIDRLYILGQDGSNAPILIVHDFKLRDGKNSIAGQGSEYLYTGMTPKTFVRQSQSVISMRDSNERPRLWCGDAAGRFFQLEDGQYEGASTTSTFTADYITLANLGHQIPMFNGIEFHGDTTSLWYCADSRLNMSEADLDELQPLDINPVDEDQFRYRVDVEKAGQYMILRIKLNSHPADGNLTLNDPPHFPLETYGRIYLSRPELGRAKPEGGRAS